MGTKFALAYANINLGDRETWLFVGGGKYSLYLSRVIFWCRYIDDVLMFSSGTEKELSEFIDTLETNHCNLKFTSKCHHRHIAFLDLTIILNENGSTGKN